MGFVRHTCRRATLPGLLVCGLAAQPLPAAAEGLRAALARAFQANPTVNAERRGTLASQELIAQAKAGYFPKISASADTAYNFQTYKSSSPGVSADSQIRPQGYGLQLSQTLFDGFRTSNTVRLAGSQAQGAAEALRRVEQTVLFDAASAYAGVLRDRDIVDLNRRSTAFLAQQLSLVRARHGFGDLTRADVAQATARHAGGLLRLSVAQQRLLESGAVYRQVIGAEPGQLAPPRPIDELVPKSFDAALAIAWRTHPSLLAASHAAAASRSQVDIVNGEYAPTVSVSASLSKRASSTIQGDSVTGGSVLGRISIPLFEGGATFSRSRQAREVASQRQLEEDAARDQVRATLMAGWGQFMASKIQGAVAATQYSAASRGLADATQQYRYGQKSLVDLLNAQQDMLDAGTNLITARADRVIATFAVARATGQLTLDRLGADLDDHARPVQAGGFPGVPVPSPAPAASWMAASAAPLRRCSLDCADGTASLGMRSSLDPLSVAPPQAEFGLRRSMQGLDGYALRPAR